ncbi:MAG: tetratricopeptide repeat protein, partial [Chloroflexi bacterium]|nr:tetratricopeptide repeat protein [Chloroflexota bacterium]
NDIFIPTREKQLRKLIIGLDKAIDENDKKSQAKYLYNLGIVAHRMKHYEEAMEYYKECMEIARNLDYQEGVAACVYQLGWLACNRNNYDQAIELFKESVTIFQKLNSPLLKPARNSLQKAEKDKSGVKNV